VVPSPSGTPGRLRYRLGDYREYEPPPFLAGKAEAVWTHRVAANATLPPNAMHRVLPDPSLSLAFRCRRDPDGRPTDARLMVIGPKNRPHVFGFTAGWETTAVRLKLEWAAPLCELIPFEHQDAETDVSDLGSARALFERLGDTRSPADAAVVLGTAVGFWSCRSLAPCDTSARALDLVRLSGGLLSVARIAARTGTSARHLRRTVQRDAGVPLKRYARIVRLLGAVGSADPFATPPWARIAGAAGFADQSHLIRECTALTGLTPGEVHRERRAEAETFNPDG
jgi:AraC-like DNA-binding protein